MAFSVIAVVSQPADNGAEAGPAATIDFTGNTPQDGDGVAVFGVYRGNVASVYIVPDGSGQASTGGNGGDQSGQAWNTERPFGQGTTTAARVLWCQVKGWTGNPTFSIASGTGPLTLVAVIFRPSSSTKLITIDKGPVNGTHTSGGSKTINGHATIKASTISFAGWFTAAATTWSSLSGTDWVVTGGSNQYRNTTGSDNSIALAHNIRTTQGTLANVGNTPGTGVAGAWCLITFAEVDLPSAGTGTQSFVQGKSAEFDSSGTTIAATLDTPVASGNGVVVQANFENITSYVASDAVTDDQGNEYVIVLRVADPLLGQQNIIAYCSSITNGPVTVTVTLNSAEIARGIKIHEVANLGTIDKRAGRWHSTVDIFSADIVETAAITPSANGAYLVGQCAADNAADADWYVPQDSWVERLVGIYPGDSNNHNSSFDQVQATAASVRGRFQQQVGGQGPILIAAFVPGAAGGATRGGPFNLGTAFNGGRTFKGIVNA